MTSNNLELIQKEIEPLSEQALNLAITDIESLKSATSILSQLNQFNDRITAEKERVTVPLNEALKAERSRWKPIETVYKEAIDSIRLKMTHYQTELVNTRKEEEQSIVSRIAPGKGHLSLETAVKKIESLETPDKTTSTEEGSVTFVETKILNITDLSLVPNEYWVINEKELLNDLKKGMTIPGAEIEIIQTPRNMR